MAMSDQIPYGGGGNYISNYGDLTGVYGAPTGTVTVPTVGYPYGGGGGGNTTGNFLPSGPTTDITTGGTWRFGRIDCIPPQRNPLVPHPMIAPATGWEWVSTTILEHAGSSEPPPVPSPRRRRRRRKARRQDAAPLNTQRQIRLRD